jgi:cytochrome c oxidase subunit III
VMFGWFGRVIHESLSGLYNQQIDRSYRIGMVWFIFSEVMFFAVFFGALFYARFYILPWLGGEGSGELTHYLLWPNFNPTWPLFKNPNPGLFVGPKSVMETWGIPAINTMILLSSGATVTWAHWGLFKNARRQLAIGLLLTILLGITFLILQAHEYTIAYAEKGLTLSSGIYGTTFFMLTGFHGLHVTIGTIMLITIFLRVLKGHFDEHHHFAFEAVSWYWHFVDVVWLGLFIFVYWI